MSGEGVIAGDPDAGEVVEDIDDVLKRLWDSYELQPSHLVMGRRTFIKIARHALPRHLWRTVRRDHVPRSRLTRDRNGTVIRKYR